MDDMKGALVNLIVGFFDDSKINSREPDEF